MSDGAISVIHTTKPRLAALSSQKEQVSNGHMVSIIFPHVSQQHSVGLDAKMHLSR